MPRASVAAMSARPSPASDNRARSCPKGKNALPTCTPPPTVACGAVPPAMNALTPTSGRGRSKRFGGGDATRGAGAGGGEGVGGGVGGGGGSEGGGGGGGGGA